MAMTNLEVFHRWAHATVNKRTGRAEWRTGNVFFDGDCIYSYGRHYCIGRITTDRAGRRVAFINSTDNSVTTNGHVSRARSAVNHLTSFMVPNPTRDPQGIIADLANAHRRAVADLAAAPVRAPARRAALARRIIGYRRDIAAIASLFDCFIPTEIDNATPPRPDLESAIAADAERRNAIEARRLNQAVKEFPTRLAEWRAHKRYSLGATPTRDAYLRIDGDEICTSQGASVPVESALAALPLLRRIRNGLTYPTSRDAVQGLVIGHYTVSEVSADHVRVGCHVIPWSEIDRIADALKGAEPVTA